MNILDGIQNFLQFINDNWTSITIIIGLALGLYKKIREYLAKSDEEKIKIAKEQIQETMLKMITEAEIDYTSWNKAGSIKRSQVIEEVFAKYPILSKAVDQAELVTWIDEQIDTALRTLREVIEINKSADGATLKANEQVEVALL